MKQINCRKNAQCGVTVYLSQGRTLAYRAAGVDQAVGFAILFQISLTAAKNLFASTLPYFNQMNFHLNVIVYSLSLILYFHAFKLSQYKINRGSFFVLMFSLSFLSLSFLLNPDLLSYRYVFPGLMTYLAECVPVVLLLPLITSIKDFLGWFYRAAYLMASVALVILALIVFFKLEMINDYSMSYGFNTMIPAIVLFSKSFREKKVFDFLLAVSCTIAVVMLGSRTPLLCIGAFFLYCLIRHFESTNYFLPLTILVIAAIALAVVYHVSIGEFVGRFLEKINFSSRTIRKLSSGSIAGSSGRDVIHQRLTGLINQSPIVGYGAFGAVKVLGGILAHNLFLDTWATFGYLAGTAIIVCLLCYTLYNIWLFRKTPYGELVAIFAFMVFPKAFVGGSIWTTTHLWYLIALFIWGDGVRAIAGGTQTESEKPCPVAGVTGKV